NATRSPRKISLSDLFTVFYIRTMREKAKCLPAALTWRLGRTRQYCCVKYRPPRLPERSDNRILPRGGGSADGMRGRAAPEKVFYFHTGTKQWPKRKRASQKRAPRKN